MCESGNAAQQRPVQRASPAMLAQHRQVQRASPAMLAHQVVTNTSGFDLSDIVVVIMSHLHFFIKRLDLCARPTDQGDIRA